MLRSTLRRHELPNKTFAANKKASYGRVNAGKNLYAYNRDLKTDALRERTYWEVNKDLHPLNRMWWLRWTKKVREEAMFTERINNFPVDQRYKLKKLLEYPSKAPLIMPVLAVIYLAYCAIRYYLFGTTAREASAGTNRWAGGLSRAPGRPLGGG